MMAGSGGSGDEATAPAGTTAMSYAGTSRTAQLAHKPLALRRRRSKGTIVGFAAKEKKADGGNNPAAASGDVSRSEGSGSSSEPHHGPKVSLSSGGGPAMGPGPPPNKPCHSSRLALLCVQNALRMGGRTQASLCPPGRARRELRDALRERKQRRKLSDVTGQGAGAAPSASLRRPGLSRAASAAAGGGSIIGSGRLSIVDDGFHIEKVLGELGAAEYERLEDEFLDRADGLERELNRDGEDIVEEKSSGDEDELDVSAIDDEYGSPSSVVGKDKPDSPGAYLHREPLYTPVGTDAASQAQQGMTGAPGSAASGKIPFNHRKLRWFDAVTAQDRAEARRWLKAELASLKRKDMQRLTNHLKKMQRRERSRVRRQKNAAAGVTSDDDDEDTTLEQAAIAAGVGKLPENMTPSLSAAMVLESMSFVPLESLEGMSKCYDAIVAAGTALLDSEVDEIQTGGGPTGVGPFSAGVEIGSAKTAEKKPTKSEIMNALAPVLITTLEQPSGEAILALARLRNQCGTRRYRRRFVQRMAPGLVRPANAALWCLRHQTDMEAILAATEMILDSAVDLFGPGWHERGQTILADTQRAETLRTAADQLKKLSSAPNDSTTDGLLALTSTPGGVSHGHHRRGNSLFTGTPTKDGTGGSGVGGGTGSGDALAEWEVLAVDREIRMSINNLFTRDWSRVVVVAANAPPRDSDSVASSQRHRRGISSNKSKSGASSHSAAAATLASSEASQQQQAEQAATAAGSQTPTSSGAGPSPLSPRGPYKVPLPLSPPAGAASGAGGSSSSTSASPLQAQQQQQPHKPPSMEDFESVFGPSFATQTNVTPDVALSPTHSAPGSPPHLSRKNLGAGFNADHAGPAGSNPTMVLTPPHTPVAGQSVGASSSVSTPPRSPPSSMLMGEGEGGASTPQQLSQSQQAQSADGQFVLGAPPVPMMSPGGGRNGALGDAAARSGAGFGPAPLSPMASSSSSHHHHAHVDMGGHVVSSPRARADSSASVGSASTHHTTSAQAAAAQTAYLRTLTSTAAERKRTVAACRALRAQISRFEEAFIQLHGRPPKGAAERAPLATTYAQYREWKRAIRADAACRIQALFRGARVRWMLLRSSNPRASRVVATRAGRPGFGAAQPADAGPGPGGTAALGGAAAQNNVIRNLSIPTDIGPSDSDDMSSPSYGQQQQPASVASPVAGRSGAGPRSSLQPDPVSDGVEVVIQGGSANQSGGGVPSLSPNWSSGPTLPKRRGGSGRGGGDESGGSGSGGAATSSGSLPYQRSDGGGGSTSSAPGSGYSSSGRSASTRGSASAASSSNLTFGGMHLNELTHPELQTRKRELKQQLKQYDMNWAKQHGRMPCKAEKEPIRHLYESYNALKSRITLLERGGGGGAADLHHQPSGAPVPYRRSPAASSSGASTASDNSSVSGDEFQAEVSPVAAAAVKASSSATKSKRKPSSSSSSSGGGGYNEPPPSSSSVPSGSGSSSGAGASNERGGGAASGTPTPSGAPPTDLAALKAEKQQLHQMLRSYEKDFFKLHNRQVSSFADIRPVASQYRRYKEIKKAIAALQQS